MKRETTNLLKQLRAAMKNTDYVTDTLHAYIVPTRDAHGSEYIAECDKRRQYISSFTGSAGTAIITDHHAALWTDGRYYVQASNQIDHNWQLMKDGLLETLKKEEWLGKMLPAEANVGVDPHLISSDEWDQLSKSLVEQSMSLVAVNQNLVDLIWEERADVPANPVIPLPLKYTGEAWHTKVSRIREEMAEKGADVLIVTALDEVAWLFNLRGSDIEYNPVFFAYALITKDEVSLFMSEDQVSSEVMLHLTSDSGQSVTVYGYDKVKNYLTQACQQSARKVWVSGQSSYALASVVSEKKLLKKASPIALMKAVKNETELYSIQNAHVKDGVALCQYFSWLEDEVTKGNPQQITEYMGSEKIEEFRKSLSDYVGPSFPTISSVGPNAAVIHYRPGRDTALVVNTTDIYLCDTGVQYRDGTTDVTRTYHFGVPSNHERECYTRVLKGHIELATAVFPQGTKGNQLDTLSRRSLWQLGLDYLHGTGHGVGAYLNVHEGPHSISFRPSAHDERGLLPGMLVTIEPGYYEDNSFGIRIENVYRLIPTATKFQFANKQYLTFEPITLLPLQQKLLMPELLTTDEISWINSYHAKVLDVIGKQLKAKGLAHVYSWLCKQTEALG